MSTPASRSTTSIPVSRFGHLVHALQSVMRLHEPADANLHNYFRIHRELGSQDRAFVAENVYAALRRKRFLEHLIGADATPRQLALATLMKLQGINARELAPLLMDSEEEWLKQLKAKSTADLPLAVQADFPDWLMEKLASFMSEADILALARGMQQPAPLDLRVNTLLDKRDEVLHTLVHSDGIAAEITPHSPFGLRLKDKPSLNRNSLFVKGKIEVQDEGSQLVGLLLAPQRREMVVDFCAGAGGKTLLLGALMQNSGRVYAFDVSEKRLNNLKPRLKRSGLSNLHPQLISNENDLKIKRLAGKIDRVLVDAPCSGLGTLRRNPDMKWRQTPEGIADLTQKQAAILLAASRLLKSGGRLVYATCSFLPEENQQIVEAFLAQHPEFKLLDTSEILAAQHVVLDTGKYLQLLPHVHGTDGFFAAVMERV
ncbi:MAG: RsmB/NOP family class I SAM-dependent RNA methyltransferase [Sulfurimicrobium sp.]|nr:RsmB/NOP family class I SAM-dependent RNA methyltransferase [Sulfurimicrobium sp.]MDP1705477.1 RsmB/NOP family class I SAM-dependent RNA methyltransferase [Sulfurimicrobium sp.]MDP1897378.1 RsmB/NOP family class I SAM-dependent RNA methyltransferase [Sulfurimicrobium sp.]